METRWKLLIIFVLSFVVSAQQLDNSCSKEDGVKCVECDRFDKSELFALMENPVSSDGKPITRVDQFLKNLPDSLRQSFIFMSDSRSFQTSNFDEPRVLMKSQNSDVVLSFNGHKSIQGEEFLGEDRVEVMVWNAKEAKFDFFDIQFPEESTPSVVDAAPIIKKNDQKCLNCHGGSDPRPNWDPYNFWQGQMPFNRDTLAPGTMESAKYLELIKQTEGKGKVKNLRMEALLSQLSSEQIKQRLDNGSLRITDFNSGDGPGVRLFDQLTPKNACRIGNRLKEREDAEDLKYVLTGIRGGCENIQDFFPPNARAANDYFFERRNQGLDKKKFSMEKLIEETTVLGQSVKQDKEQRQLWTIEKLMRREYPGDSEAEIQKKARTEMDKIISDGNGRLENREAPLNGVIMAKFRYALEPLGIDVDSWSMSIDSSTYSFADLLFNIFRDMPMAENGSCEDLAKQSVDALSKSEPYLADLRANCSDKKLLNELVISNGLDNSTDVMKKYYGEKVNKILNANGCVACHTYQVNGAPIVPFGDQDKLRKMLEDDNRTINGGWTQSIWSRVTRPEGTNGHMPLGGPSLTDEDKSTLKTYFNLFIENNNDEIN